MNNLINVSSVPVIVAMVYFIIEGYKSIITTEKATHYIPIISGIAGAILGVMAFYVSPELMIAKDVFSASIVGLASGLSATGANQIGKQIKKDN